VHIIIRTPRIHKCESESLKLALQIADIFQSLGLLVFVVRFRFGCPCVCSDQKSLCSLLCERLDLCESKSSSLKLALQIADLVQSLMTIVQTVRLRYELPCVCSGYKALDIVCYECPGIHKRES